MSGWQTCRQRQKWQCKQATTAAAAAAATAKVTCAQFFSNCCCCCCLSFLVVPFRKVFPSWAAAAAAANAPEAKCLIACQSADTAHHRTSHTFSPPPPPPQSPQSPPIADIFTIAPSSPLLHRRASNCRLFFWYKNARASHRQNQLTKLLATDNNNSTNCSTLCSNPKKNNFNSATQLFFSTLLQELHNC